MQEEDDLEKIVINFQHPYYNGYSIVDIDDENWEHLLVEFAKVLNKAGYQVPIDLVEKYIHNGIAAEYKNRQKQLKLNFGESNV